MVSQVMRRSSHRSTVITCMTHMMMMMIWNKLTVLSHFTHETKGCDHVFVKALASHPIKVRTIDMLCWNLLPSLGGELDHEFRRTVKYSLPFRNPWRVFIHGTFFGPLGVAHLLVWSELWQPFYLYIYLPIRDFIMQWSQAFNLVCEVVLRPLYNMINDP